MMMFSRKWGHKADITCAFDGSRQTVNQSDEWPQALAKQKASHMHALVTWSKIHCRRAAHGTTFSDLSLLHTRTPKEKC